MITTLTFVFCGIAFVATGFTIYFIVEARRYAPGEREQILRERAALQRREFIV